MGKPRDLISLVEDRPGHVKSHAVDGQKLTKATAWEPAHGFESSVQDVVSWYTKHTGWWRPTILEGARDYFVSRYPDLVAALETS